MKQSNAEQSPMFFWIDTVKELYYGPYHDVRVCLKHPKLGVALLCKTGDNLLTLPSGFCNANEAPEMIAQKLALELFQIDTKFTEDHIITKIRWQDIRAHKDIYTVVFLLETKSSERFKSINGNHLEWFSSMDQMNIDAAIRPILFQLKMNIPELHYAIFTKLYH